MSDLLKKRIWLLVIFSFLVSASHAQLIGSKKKAVATPAWYVNPPKSTDTYLYGAAEGRYLDATKQAALANIGASLGVDITASSVTLERDDGYSSGTTYQGEVKASVGNIEFSRFDVQETVHDPKNKRYWVLMRVDRIAMSNDIQNKISTLSSELDDRFEEFNRSSNLSQVMSGKELSKEIEKLKAYIDTSYKLNNSYDRKPMLSKLNKKRNQLNRAKDALQVTVQHDGNTKMLANALEKLLTENNIKVVNSARANTTTISINSSMRHTYLENHGAHQVRLTVNLQAMDNKGNVLATSKFTKAGASPSNKQAALEQANTKLAGTFKSQGLITSLGL